MNYIGSKYSLLPFLDKAISEVTCNLPINAVFCDLFAGTAAVGRYFKSKGCRIIANDLQYYSYVLNKQYIENHTTLMFKGLEEDVPMLSSALFDEARADIVCQYLDSIPSIKGFIYNNYCKGEHGDADDYRLYFSDANGAKCDAIRIKIEEWNKSGKLLKGEYFFLLATLLENIDKVANTASVYGAFLKHIKVSANKPLHMRPAEMILNKQEHSVYNSNANELIRHIHPDILYLDPPYNHRQYSANYHILETIALYDNPNIKGKTGMRDCSIQKSQYCSRNEAADALDDLVQHANCKFIFLSYNNEGLLSFDQIKRIMSKRGEYGFYEQNYNRFKADNESNVRHIKTDTTTEYLHYVKINAHQSA